MAHSTPLRVLESHPLAVFTPPTTKPTKHKKTGTEGLHLGWLCLRGCFLLWQREGGRDPRQRSAHPTRRGRNQIPKLRGVQVLRLLLGYGGQSPTAKCKALRAPQELAACCPITTPGSCWRQQKRSGRHESPSILCAECQVSHADEMDDPVLIMMTQQTSPVLRQQLL